MIYGIVRWVVLTGSVLLAAYIIPNIFVADFVTALLVALVLGLINITIKPIIKLLTLPLNILTLGVLGLLINAFFFWLVGIIVSGFDVLTWGAAFFGALIVSVVMWIADRFIK